MKFSGYQMLLPVKDLEGKEIPERDERGFPIKLTKKEGETEERNKPLTVKAVLRTSLVTSIQAVQEDEKRKFDNYQLASKIINLDPEDQLEIPSDEITHLKKKVSFCWGIEVYGFIYNLLEGHNKDWKPQQEIAG